LHEQNHELAIKKALNCLAWFKRQDYIALTIMCHQLLIKIYTSLNDIDTANEYKYQILNQLQQRNVTTQLLEKPLQPTSRIY
jgi:hypothetical protein